MPYCETPAVQPPRFCMLCGQGLVRQETSPPQPFDAFTGHQAAPRVNVILGCPLGQPHDHWRLFEDKPPRWILLLPSGWSMDRIRKNPPPEADHGITSLV